MARELNFSAAQLVADCFQLTSINSKPLTAGHSTTSKNLLSPFVAFPFGDPLDVLNTEIGQRKNTEMTIPYQIGNRDGGYDQGYQYFHVSTLSGYDAGQNRLFVQMARELIEGYKKGRLRDF
jgi:hypothetical protein